VLYVLAEFPVLSETFISNEIRAMRAAGHQVVPLALRRHSGRHQPEDATLRAETLHLAEQPAAPALLTAFCHPAALVRALPFIRAQRGLPARSLLLAGARVAVTARRLGCTHIHAHFAHSATATAIVGARLAGITVSFTGHGYDIYGTPCDLPQKLAAVDLAIAVCDGMLNDFRGLSPEVRSAIVRCGVDPTRFRPLGDVPRNGRLLAIGRLAPQKGYEVLLDALARLPPGQRPQLDAVGEGALRPALEAQITALGLAPWVRLLGARDSAWIAAEAPAYLGLVAPFVITPDGDRDTGPIVVKEAMAMGLPVVASALMGIKETVDAACGWLVPPGDAAALADALGWLAHLPEAQRRSMGAAGRARVEAYFTLDRQAQGLAAAIRSLPR
jgi:glycosyltransferase involved in cell wall biosynthesis